MYYPPVQLVNSSEKQHDWKTYSTLFSVQGESGAPGENGAPGPMVSSATPSCINMENIICYLRPHKSPRNYSSMFSTTSLKQGPRGLPGERGRPGPSGVAVSVSFFFLSKFTPLHPFTTQTDAALSSRGWNWLKLSCRMHLYMFNSADLFRVHVVMTACLVLPVPR